MLNTLTGLGAALFLGGVLVSFASVVPALEKSAGKLLGYGFLLAVVGIGVAVVASFLLGT
jgi:hypothetical protein